MLAIGLTGGIGSGKSTAASLFAKQGIPIIDTDAIARQLVAPQQPAYIEIVNAFGGAILDKEQQLDRKRLRDRVFDSTTERKRLEAILHPKIREEVQRQLSTLDAPYCIVIIPLLIEAKFTDLVDRILVIDADEELQITRACKRSGMSEMEIRKIMAAQISRAEKLKEADDIIQNNSFMNHFENEIARLHTQYLTLSQRKKD